MNVLSLCDGISCGMVALERAGIKVDKYYASEIDPHAIKVSEKNYPNIIRLGDMLSWKNWDIEWDNIDLILAGTPCQSLSIIQSKTRQNLDGKSKLFFTAVDILKHVKKINPNIKFVFENVASMNCESKETISQMLGCEPVFINSADFSAQSRPRYYWCNFNVSMDYEPCKDVLFNIMESNVDEKYFYKQKFEFIGNDKAVCAILDIKGHEVLKRVHSPHFKCHTLTTCGGGNTQKKVMTNGRPRKLTPIEYERLQTLPDNYTQGVSDTWRYTVCGNGWTVDVIAYILSFIKKEDLSNMRLGDLEKMKEEALWGNVYLSDNELNTLVGLIDDQATINPENLPIVQELREQLAKVTAELDDLKMNPPVKVDSDAFELALQLAEVTAERDLAVKYLKQANNDNGACYGCKWFDSFADRCMSEVNRIICDTGENNMWEWKGLQE